MLHYNILVTINDIMISAYLRLSTPFVSTLGKNSLLPLFSTNTKEMVPITILTNNIYLMIYINFSLFYILSRLNAKK